MQKCSVEIAFARLLMAIYTLSNNKSVACRNSCSGYFHTLTKFIVLSAHGKAFKMFFSDTRNVTAKWKIVQTGPLWACFTLLKTLLNHLCQHLQVVAWLTAQYVRLTGIYHPVLRVSTNLLQQGLLRHPLPHISHCLNFQLIHPTLPTELYLSMFLCPCCHDYTACQ